MNNKSIKKNYIFNIILTMSSFIFPLIVFPYVTRIIQPAGIGRVSMATSVIAYFGIFSQLGIPTYGIRECAKVRDDKIKLSQKVKELFFINIISCIITYSIFFVVINCVPKFQNERYLYFIMSVSIILNTIGMEWLYRALEEYEYITWRSVIFKAIAVVLMFVFIKDKSHYIIYGFLTIFASSASNILNLVKVKKYVYLYPYSIKNLKCFKHIKGAFIFLAMSCSTTIYMNLDTIMLGFMTSDTEVGYYDAAVKIKKVLVSIIIALGTVLLPRVTYLYEKKERNEFFRLNCKAIKYIFFISIPLVVYFFFFAEDCILFICGDMYKGAIIPMKIIIVTLCFIGLSNITGIQILVPMGMEIRVLVSEICGAIVDFILNLLLIPRYGASGAAFGTVMAEIIVLFVQCLFLLPILKKNIYGIEIIKVFWATLGAVISVIWCNYLDVSSFLRLLLSFIIYLFTYFICLLFQKHEFAIEIKTEIMFFINKT